MTKIFIAASLLFSISVTSISQVTIGSSTKPKNGALLDIKQNDSLGENSNKGLGLPRVSLQAIDQLEPCTVTDDLSKSSHIGLTVYNMTDNSSTIGTLKEGLYFGMVINGNYRG